MNFSTRHYVMIIFVVLNLVNQGATQDGSGVVCAWSFSKNVDTNRSVCSDGIYRYVFANDSCHRTKPSEPTAGVDCKTPPPENDPTDGVTCDWYDLVHNKKDWTRDYYTCTQLPADDTQSEGSYFCGSMNNIEHCYGSYISKEKLPSVIN
ncbi:uncharacterized protein MELLADRAFT_123741 [Melampsora larici-populina 98AG31]|uniref:Secreted protein n=1 Tax=Melampsora larici-populina (strain 98AG31 / pathotype 3-4-7) TaxID=747676 RepID=F4RKU0_MELLP|nr:uncharacterized protein MELLADRAFT_123741 [Melampsora larici-populina 98AG31]EGG06784.1 secreted protein [Melampsora larici-populina 98AG31]